MKRILSFMLALMMLLGCSLMVFAKEPCEEPGCTGEIMPHMEHENFEQPYNHVCPDCGHEPFAVEVYYDEYICNECDTYAYRIFDHYKTYCFCITCGCAEADGTPLVKTYYSMYQYEWRP